MCLYYRKHKEIKNGTYNKDKAIIWNIDKKQKWWQNVQFICFKNKNNIFHYWTISVFQSYLFPGTHKHHHHSGIENLFAIAWLHTMQEHIGTVSKIKYFTIVAYYKVKVFAHWSVVFLVLNLIENATHNNLVHWVQCIFIFFFLPTNKKVHEQFGDIWLI